MTRTSNSFRAPCQAIISGGQTGVDRAALDIARSLKIPHRGWCPRGRLAEDGPIDPVYNLQETSSSDYSERTERNVIDSDGTLIIYQSKLVGGSLLTSRLATMANRPLMLFDLDQNDYQVIPSLLSWLEANDIRHLNVAGPRESTQPGIYDRATTFLQRLLTAGA